MADVPRVKKTFKLPAPARSPQKPPPPKWKSAGDTADVFYNLEGAYYEMRGMAALQANIATLPQAMQDAAGCEMANIAADVIRDARDHYVPYKLGHLSESGRSDEYEPGRGIGITDIGMWFGGPPDVGMGGGISSAEATMAGLTGIDPSLYAEVQHEDLSLNHPLQGGPKYLERPLLAMLPNILPRIARAIAEIEGVTPRSVEFTLGGGPRRDERGRFLPRSGGPGTLGPMGPR